MNKVTITLELTYKEVAEVMALLNHTSQQPVNTPISQEHLLKDKSPSPTTKKPSKPIIKPTAGKKVKMPALGRTQKDIDKFMVEEQERFNKKTEEELLKEQRAEERAQRKAEKEAEELAKKQEEEEKLNEVKAIKEKTSSKSTLPAKPWNL